jgi:hypothetical protein
MDPVFAMHGKDETSTVATAVAATGKQVIRE